MQCISKHTKRRRRRKKNQRGGGYYFFKRPNVTVSGLLPQSRRLASVLLPSFLLSVTQWSWIMSVWHSHAHTECGIVKRNRKKRTNAKTRKGFFTKGRRNGTAMFVKERTYFMIIDFAVQMDDKINVNRSPATNDFFFLSLWLKEMYSDGATGAIHIIASN